MATANAQITVENEIVNVDIPVTFSVKDLNSDDTESFVFQLVLKADNTGYTITEFNGEELYQVFTLIKNKNQWEAERKLALQQRLWIYEAARAIEDKFDSVIWYAPYNEQYYFYVVDGAWTNYFLNYDTRHLQNSGTNMGLVDSKGNVIIPMEYDLIGSIGFFKNNLVEVTKDGKVGYFDIERKQLVVEPVYDLIVPYHQNSFAIVKQDSVYGWLSNDFTYQPGLPGKHAERWIKDFEYLKQPIRLKADNHTFCEIPSAEHTGNGIIVPPSYLSKHGIFDAIEGNISTTDVPINGWTDYKETTGSFLETITDNIHAVITTVRERYLEGREEFYVSSTVMFVNPQHDTLRVANINGEEISMHTIDTTLLEVRTPHDFWFDEYDASAETNLYEHTYFSITNDRDITPLSSKRLFAQTEFVKLDSSYLTGLFMVYNSETQRQEPASFLSAKTITFMRDEILASYGYTFPDNERVEHFKNIVNWYSPQHTTIEAFESDMTAIDQHNLAFLNKVLARMQKPLT